MSSSQEESTALLTCRFNFHLLKSPANAELRLLGTLHILLLMFTDFFSQGLFKDASPLILTSSARVFWRGCALFFSRGSSLLHFLNEVCSKHFTGQNPEAGVTPDHALKEPKWASPSAVGSRSLSGLPSEKSLMEGFMFGDSACIFSKEA